MIRQKTVLVLGAGASAPYGFPLGVDLVDQICREILDSGEKSNTLSERLERIRINPQKLHHFAKELRRARPYSVDAFLETRPEFIEAGKAAIADVLLRAEANSSVDTGDIRKDWYRYVFSRSLLRKNTDYYLSQARCLTIVTFNFDRSFEHALFHSLRATFGLSSEDAIRLAQAISVHHVHGLLGDLDVLNPEKPGTTAYGPRDTQLPIATSIAAESIRIVHEPIGEIIEAQKALHEATHVYFVGFGYEERNLEKINVPGGLKAKRVYGTCYHMTGLERTPVAKYFGRSGVSIDLSDVDALGFFRAYAEALVE